MAANVLYWVLAAYGVLIVAVNSIGLYKFGPEPWVIFQAAGGAILLTLACLALAQRISARWVWSIVAILLLTDIGWRLVT